MPADPGPALRAAALIPRSPLDTTAVLRRARRLRARRRAGLAAAALAVVAPLLVNLPASGERLRFVAPGVADRAAAEQACAGLRGPRVFNENGFVALGLSDELPRRLVEQTTVIADRCVVDEQTGAVIGAVLRLEDEGVGPVALWLLLPPGTQTADLDFASWLLADGPPVVDHVLELDGAVAVVRGDDLAILAGDPSEPQVSAWDALVRGGVPDSFAAATLPSRFTRPPLPGSDMTVRGEGLPRESRVLPSGFGTRLRLPSGRELELVLPARVQAEPGLTYRPESVGIVDDDARTPRTSVTTASAGEVGEGLVSGGPTRLPNGAVLEVWRGGLGNDPLVTATLEGWTLVLDGPNGELAERIVAAVDWSVDADGFLLLASGDPQVLIADGVVLDFPTGDATLVLSLHPGCPSAGEDLERSPGLGVWCADGFTVVGQSRDGTVLEALHEQLRVLDVPQEDAADIATVYRDPAAGLEVAYPRDWARAPQRLTPNLGGVPGPGNLVEVLTLGTGPMPVGGGDRCAQVPERAVEALGPGDALVTLQERESDEDFPPRPAAFRSPNVDPPTTLDCFANADDIEHVRYDFADGGRGFYAYVTVRRDATAQVRAEALAILDSLEVEPN